MDLKKDALKGTTQNHLSIEDISNDMIVLKDGSCAYVLEVSSVNFDLLSEREQEAIIYAYASLLNSLTFPIEVFVHSALKDVSSYLEYLKRWEDRAGDDLIKNQISYYRKFISQVIEKNNVLTKTFYVAIPFMSLELGVAGASSSIFTQFTGKKTPKKLPMDKKKIIDKAKSNLDPKKEHIVQALGRIGLRATQLNTAQLVSLFYSIYNQDKIEVKDLHFKEGEVPVILGKLKNGSKK